MKDLIDALNSYNRCLEAERKAKDSCEYDADYFCYREVNRREEAEKELEAALNKVIDERVRFVLRGASEVEVKE